MASIPCRSCKTPEKTIDDCYNQVIEKLTTQGKIKEISSHLMSLASNYQRVQYVYNILEELSFLPSIRSNAKDDQISDYYRNHGNLYFKQKKYFEAWQSYNLSLMYAVTTSENFTYAISNRSAVFFNMEKYRECLEDIELVFRTQYPENLKDKLLERKRQCLSNIAIEESKDRKEDINDNIKIIEILKLKGPRNKKYESASSKLKVVYTEEMGRHVIAKEDISVGEILVEEDPYLTVLLQPQFLFCCAHCLSRNMNLYPCMMCAYTLYCSVECRETAYKKYHSVECDLLASILGMEFSKMDLLALRAVIRARTDEEDWFATFKTAEEAESRINTDIWGCIKDEGGSWVYNSKYYTPIHTLASNVEKRSLSDIFRKSLYAAVLTHFLFMKFFPKNNDDVLAVKAKRHISGTLLLHIMTSPTNMHSISTTIANIEGKYVDENHIASGAYPFLSLLNHSCAPSVVRYSKLGTGQMSLVAVRPIKKGMQVFDNYGYHHAVQDRETRQSDLKFQYKFTCACEACVNDWPLHVNLHEAMLAAGLLKKKDECLAAEVIEKLMIADKKTALKYYQPLCELITVLDSHAPCKELAECQEALKQCLAIFYGVLPYDYSKSVGWKAFPPCESTGGPPHVWSVDSNSFLNSSRKGPDFSKRPIDT